MTEPHANGDSLVQYDPATWFNPNLVVALETTGTTGRTRVFFPNFSMVVSGQPAEVAAFVAANSGSSS